MQDSIDSNRGLGVRVNTQVLQLGPGLFKIVSLTTDGQFIGSLDVTVTNQDGIAVLARAFSQFAMNSSKKIVRASGIPPIDLSSLT